LVVPAGLVTMAPVNAAQPAAGATGKTPKRLSDIPEAS
jgi:hypothetical protein